MRLTVESHRQLCSVGLKNIFLKNIFEEVFFADSSLNYLNITVFCRDVHREYLVLAVAIVGFSLSDVSIEFQSQILIMKV